MITAWVTIERSEKIVYVFHLWFARHLLLVIVSTFCDAFIETRKGEGKEKRAIRRKKTKNKKQKTKNKKQKKRKEKSVDHPRCRTRY